MGIGKRLADLAPGVGEKPQRTSGGHRGIELAQRTGRGVARIGESLAAGGLLARVESGEIGLRHVDFAANLQGLRPVVDMFGDVRKGAQVGGDVLAGGPVAAGRAPHEAAVFVAKRHRKAVDLRLCHHLQRDAGVVTKLLEESADTFDEFGEVLVGESVGERKHRPGVNDLGETARHRRANTPRGTAVADQVGKTGLYGLVAPPQRVILGVADDGSVVLIVGLVMRRDFRRQHLQFGFRLGRRQLRNRSNTFIRRIAHPARPRRRLSAAARASSVTFVPASIRAISSLRAVSSSTSTRVLAPASLADLDTRQW